MEATKRRKLEDGTEGTISMLPDDVVLHILSLLPTVDAVRTSVLSKRWRHLWTLVSAVDICGSRDAQRFRRLERSGTGRKKVLNFVDECLKYPYKDTTVSRFRFHMMYNGGGDRINKWLRFPGLHNVKDLEMSIWAKTTYVLPQSMLCLRRLTRLDLTGNFALETPFPVSLPALKLMYLSSVGVDDQVLSNVLSGCPSLEKLYLIFCRRLLDPQVTSSSLKSLEFCNENISARCLSLRVEAVNLRSFVFVSGPSLDVNLVGCRAIRNLSLSGASISDRRLDDLVSKSPLLDSLTLDNCRGLQRIRLSNQCLKHFTFASAGQLDLPEATIDAPNLVSFCYTGVSLIQISVNEPNLVDVNINIFDYPRTNYDTEWYLSLIKFLSEFNGCKKVLLTCSPKKALIIPEELRKIHGPPFPDLKDLTVKVPGSESYMKNKLNKSLVWMAPSLESLSIDRVRARLGYTHTHTHSYSFT